LCSAYLVTVSATSRHLWRQPASIRAVRTVPSMWTQLVIALASLAAGARCQVNQEIYSEQDLLAIDSEAQPVAVAVLPPPGFEAASASVLSSLPPGGGEPGPGTVQADGSHSFRWVWHRGPWPGVATPGQPRHADNGRLWSAL